MTHLYLCFFLENMFAHEPQGLEGTLRVSAYPSGKVAGVLIFHGKVSASGRARGCRNGYPAPPGVEEGRQPDMILTTSLPQTLNTRSKSDIIEHLLQSKTCYLSVYNCCCLSVSLTAAVSLTTVTMKLFK